MRHERAATQMWRRLHQLIARNEAVNIAVARNIGSDNSTQVAVRRQQASTRRRSAERG